MDNLVVSASPHIRDKTTTSSIMRDVLIALVPSFVASNILFGLRSALIVAVCVVTCLLCEWLFEKIMKWPNTLGDLSAAVTGVLLAFNLPVTIPIWQAVLGSAIAIVVVKQIFGGIGKNFANPAVTARVVMFLAFSVTMTNWVTPDGALSTMAATSDAVSAATSDAVSSATPLALITNGNIDALPPIKDMLFGLRGGALGETCSLALLIGGIYLLVRKVITWHIPVAFLVTVFGLTAALGMQPVYQMLSGGLLLSAFFMATDYVTSPSTGVAKLIFGFGCGCITVLVRAFGNYPEGVSYAILLMNILVPLITLATRRMPLGGVKK